MGTVPLVLFLAGLLGELGAEAEEARGEGLESLKTILGEDVERSVESREAERGR